MTPKLQSLNEAEQRRAIKWLEVFDKIERNRFKQDNEETKHGRS